MRRVASVLVVLTVSGSVNLAGTDILLRILWVLLLIAINAFFVTAEFSVVSVRRSRINQLVEAGDIQAKTVQNLQRSIDKLLSTTQLGITLSSLALGWIGETTMAVVVVRWMMALPLPAEVSHMVAHSIAIPLAFFLIAYLQIVLGELCPKAVALLYSEQLARFLGLPIRAIARFFNPFLWILNHSTRLLLRLGGIDYTGQMSTRVTSEELQVIIATEQESPGLKAKERELLNNIFNFGDVVAGQVMVQRTSIVALPSTATFAMLLNQIAATGYSRYPVIGESLDDICGIIYFKELAEPLAQGQLELDAPIEPWIRPARFVPESTHVSTLLPVMQRSLQAMVIVVDEFGGTAGLLTIKDLIAEIIGSYPQQHTEDLAVQILDQDTFLVQAQMNLEEVNEVLNLDLPLIDEYQTLGGFLLYEYQKIPPMGETLQYDNLDLTVVSAEGPRLDQIRIHRRSPDAEADAPQEFEQSAAEVNGRRPPASDRL